jgi:hypothetical protein
MVLAGDAFPALKGLLEGSQPFILLADPAHRVGVDALQEGTQRGVVERPVILHPAADDRVDSLRDFPEVKPDLAVKPPSRLDSNSQRSW